MSASERFSLSRATETLTSPTPGKRDSAVSILAAQLPQSMPPTEKVRSSDAPFKLPRVEIFMVSLLNSTRQPIWHL